MGSNDTPKRERAYAEVSGTLQHDFSHSFVLSKGPSFLPQKQQLLLLVKVLHFIADGFPKESRKVRRMICIRPVTSLVFCVCLGFVKFEF